MATHSSILAWRIPWTEEPGKLQSMGSQRVGHDWATSLSFHLWEPGPDLPAGLGGSPGGGRGQLWLTVGTQTLVRTIHLCELSWRLPLWNQGSGAGTPQAKPPPWWERSPTAQQTGCLKTTWAHSHLQNSPWHSTCPVAQTVKSLQGRRPGFDPWVGKFLWRREWHSTPHSSIFAWRIPWTEKPGELHFMGL